MKAVRLNRKAIAQLKEVVRPLVYTWTGNKAFKRGRRKRFDRLSHMLRDDEFLHFCAAIGLVEVTWSLVEAQLDRWCQIVFITLKWRGKDGKVKEVPRPYARKVEFLRGAFAKAPALRKYASDGI